ncbi:MAG: MarR family transcriptional regulator [Burkholderiales bacterium]|nr:MarR family transcriptional regulator [Burkholderiales bacterium]MDE2567229.1 MarR family transcriptional regulator [Burkholderiales bacterium]
MNEERLRLLAAFRSDLRQFHHASEQLCAGQGLTAQHYQALLALAAAGRQSPVTVSVLAQQLHIKHNSAVGLVDRMEGFGLAERHPSEADRRSVVIEITAHGRQLLRRLAEAHWRELHRLAPAFLQHFSVFAAEPPPRR